MKNLLKFFIVGIFLLSCFATSCDASTITMWLRGYDDLNHNLTLDDGEGLPFSYQISWKDLNGELSDVQGGSVSHPVAAGFAYNDITTGWMYYIWMGGPSGYEIAPNTITNVWHSVVSTAEHITLSYDVLFNRTNNNGVNAIPEPSTMFLFGLGASVFVKVNRKRTI